MANAGSTSRAFIVTSNRRTASSEVPVFDAVRPLHNMPNDFGKHFEGIMGGYGSGRRYRWDTRDVADDSYCVSINDSHRGGRLEPGCYSSWTWSRGGQPVASISVIVERGLLRLRYRTRSGDGESQDIDQPTQIEWMPCHFGGSRPWFRCPGQSCGRRVGTLYGPGKYFLCRQCYGLTYQS
jgi:hypothetical protein